jgi:hypothetical protein
MKLAFVLVFTIIIAPKAFACRDALSETHTFFQELPPSLSSKEAVAKIKVVSTEESKDHDRITKAKVVSAIKGLKANKTIKIFSDMSSCNRDPEIQIGKEYYVAGTIDANGIFRGIWKQQELAGHK